jgi:hypothetical protein
MTNNSSSMTTSQSSTNSENKTNTQITNNSLLLSTLYRAAASGTQEKSKDKSFNAESVCHHHQITSQIIIVNFQKQNTCKTEENLWLFQQQQRQPNKPDRYITTTTTTTKPPPHN